MPLQDENVAEVEVDIPSDLTDDEINKLNALAIHQEIVSGPSIAWWSTGGNQTYFQARPFDEGLRPRSTEAVIQVGVSFVEADAPLPNPGWLERLDAAGFASLERPGTGAMAEIWKTKPLASFVEASSPSEQAKRLATWVDESLNDLLTIPPTRRS